MTTNFFPNRFFPSIFVAAISLAATGVHAADGPAVVRVYDGADLVTAHPSHLAPVDSLPAGGGGGQSTFSNSSPSEDRSWPSRLLSAVRASLNSEETSQGTVTLQDTSLVVNEPAEAQLKVVNLLDELRAKSHASVQIQVDAMWVLLPPGPITYNAAFSPDRADVFARATTVCFNGQTVAVRQVRETEVVSGATPVVAPGVKMNSYSTETDRPGIAIELTPQLQPGGAIVVDFKAEAMSEAGPAASVKPTTQPEDAPVLRPDKLVQSIATTVALKPGQPMIVGGVTQDTTVFHGKTMCLIMTATVLPPVTSTPAQAPK